MQSHLSSPKTKVYEEYAKTDSANGIEGKVFIYDSSYSTPAAAYEAGACYIVDNGDYDVLLPFGNYTISALGTFTEGTGGTSSSGTTVTTNVTGDVGSRLYGDVNLDGAVDIADAVLLNKAIAGAVMLNDQSRLNSDCHADDTLETNDSIALLQFLVHTINTLPVTD